MEESNERRPRQVNTSGRDARIAIDEVASACNPIRARLSVIAARAGRGLSARERTDLLEECAGVRREAEQLGTRLTERLVGAPAAVIAHSRVVDAKRALDNLSATLSDVERVIVQAATR